MEGRVARLVAEGLDTCAVADELGVTRKTVDWHLSRIYRKLGARTRAELSGVIARSAEAKTESKPARKRNKR
jgi:DNA-binding CsgD family transcriptional regulator